MARYKIIAESGAYMARDPTPVRLDLGADSISARAYNVRAPVYELLKFDDEIFYAGIPGPHLEPLDDEAREAMAAYWLARPGATLDPTRSLPLGRDPMVAATFESATLAMLERMAAEAAGKPVASANPATDAKLDALIAATTQLTAIVAALAAPAPARKG